MCGHRISSNHNTLCYKKVLSSSDPNQLTFSLTDIRTLYLAFFLALSNILSGIYSDIPSCILSYILSDMISGILSDICSDILSGILIWHLFWHSFWHLFKHVRVQACSATSGARDMARIRWRPQSRRAARGAHQEQRRGSRSRTEEEDVLACFGMNFTHRIHGAGIYANMTGVYWWDPCYHI